MADSSKKLISKNITEFLGDGVKIEENKKSVTKREETFFVTLIESLLDLEERTKSLINQGIDTTLFEDPYHFIIEGLIYKYYGGFKTKIIFWWLCEGQAEGTKSVTLNGEDGEEYIINTPLQLFRALSKLKVNDPD